MVGRINSKNVGQRIKNNNHEDYIRLYSKDMNESGPDSNIPTEKNWRTGKMDKGEEDERKTPIYKEVDSRNKINWM